MPSGIYNVQPRSMTQSIKDWAEIDDAKQRRQINALALQDRQRGIEEATAIQNAMAGLAPDATPEQAAMALRRLGPKGMGLADSLLKTEAEVGYKKAQAARERTQSQTDVADALKKSLSAYRDMLPMVRTRRDAVQWTAAQYQDPTTKAFVSRIPLEQMVQNIPEDEAGFNQWRQEVGMGIEKFVQDQTAKQGQVLSSETARRGQDITAATARRGQDVSAATTRRGQDIQKGIAEQTDKRTRELAQTKPEKNLTEDQGKATSWLERMDQAEAIVRSAPKEALTSTGTLGGMAGATIGAVPYVGNTGLGKMGRSLVESKDRQAVRTAQEAWVAGLLRSDTGAAYKDMEKDDIIRTFFPQPGEDDAQIALKQNLRDGVRRAMTVRAGPGVERLSKVPKSDSGSTPTGPFSDAEKERRYQEWKAKQK